MTVTTFTDTTNPATDLKFDNNYATARTAANAFSTYNAISVGQYATNVPVFYIERGYLYFNTAAIPVAAIITAAKLQLYCDNKFESHAYDIVVLNGQPTYPHNPLVVADYDRTLYAGNGGSIASAALVALAYNDLILNATGISWINKGGATKFCLQSSRDISGTAPLANENEYANLGNPGVGGHEPKLEVTYSLGGVIAVCNAAALVAEKMI